MTWEIFLGIAALVSFVVSITVPLLKLNESIVKLNSSINVIKEALDRIETENKESHNEIWKHNDEQDKIIARHEKQLIKIEHTMQTNEKLFPGLAGLRPETSEE